MPLTRILQVAAVVLFIGFMIGLRLFLVSVPTMFMYGFVAGALALAVLLWLGSDDKRLY